MPLMHFVADIEVPAPLTKESEERQKRALTEVLDFIVRRFGSATPEVAQYLAKHLKAEEPAGTMAEKALAKKLSRKDYTPQERAQLNFITLLNAFEYRRKLLEGALTAPQVAEVLGRTRQTPHDRRERRELLAVYDNGAWRFPSWQFDAQGPEGVLEGLPDVLKALDLSDLGALNWLAMPEPELEGLAPKDALKQGFKERVLELARGVGRR